MQDIARAERRASDVDVDYTVFVGRLEPARLGGDGASAREHGSLGHPHDNVNPNGNPNKDTNGHEDAKGPEHELEARIERRDVKKAKDEDREEKARDAADVDDEPTYTTSDDVDDDEPTYTTSAGTIGNLIISPDPAAEEEMRRVSDDLVDAMRAAEKMRDAARAAAAAEAAKAAKTTRAAEAAKKSSKDSKDSEASEEASKGDASKDETAKIGAAERPSASLTSASLPSASSTNADASGFPPRASTPTPSRRSKGWRVSRGSIWFV